MRSLNGQPCVHARLLWMSVNEKRKKHEINIQFVWVCVCVCDSSIIAPQIGQSAYCVRIQNSTDLLILSHVFMFIKAFASALQIYLQKHTIIQSL